MAKEMVNAMTTEKLKKRDLKDAFRGCGSIPWLSLLTLSTSPHPPLPAMETHLAHHAARARAHADDGAFVAIDRGDALRHDLDAEAVAPRLDAPGQRAAVQQPMPQARVGARGKRLPELVDTGGFHRCGMFTVIILEKAN